MYVEQIDDHAMTGFQMRPRGLRQKQRCLQVAADQIVPLRFGNAADRCRVKGRGVVYQDVQPTTPLSDRLNQIRQTGRVFEVGGKNSR